MSLRSLLKNWPYKLMALGTAVTLALYVQSERNPWQSIPVLTEIKKINAPKDYDITLSKDKVWVTLHGRKADVEAVKTNGFDASVDLKEVPVGTSTVAVNVSIPDNAPRKISWETAIRKVTVTAESKSSKTLPIEVKLKTSPPIGYAANSPSVLPDTATISGRSSLVRSISKLVVTVNPSPMEPSVDEEVAIKALKANGDEVKDVTVEPVSAHVSLKLVEAAAGKSVFIGYNVVGQPQFPYRVAKISVTPNSVTIKGRPESLAGTSILTTDEVDITGAAADVVRYVGLHVPPGLKVEGPREVRVTVKIVLGGT